MQLSNGGLYKMDLVCHDCKRGTLIDANFDRASMS